MILCSPIKANRLENGEGLRNLYEDSLKRAMEKYTKWLDRQLKSAIVDQNLEQKENEASG
jgi:hypothetical protein